MSEEDNNLKNNVNNNNNINNNVNNNVNIDIPKLNEKLVYKIAYVSSENTENSALSLMDPKPNSHGWQSAGNCKYPQEILIELKKPCKLKQIKIVSHQLKISSKVDIFVTSPLSYVLAKLGTIYFDKNEKNKYKSRQMLNINTDCNCDRIKLVFDKNFPNKQNKFNQIGIISIELFGEYIKGKIKKIMKLNKKIQELTQQKNLASDKDQYDEAKKIKAQIEEIQAKIIEINEEEDFDFEDDTYNKELAIIKKNRQKIAEYQRKLYERPIKSGAENEIDNQKVGNPLSFSQQFFKIMEKQKDNEDNPFVKIDKDEDDISSESFSGEENDEDKRTLAYLLKMLPKDVVMPLFTTEIKEIIECIQRIIEDIQLFPGSKLFPDYAHPIEIIVAACHASIVIFKTGMAGPKIKCLELLECLFVKFKANFTNNFSNHTINKCIELSLNMLGDKNSSLSEKIEYVLTLYADTTEDPSRLIAIIIKKPVIPTLANSKPHRNARYSLVAKLIGKFSYKDEQYDLIAKYAAIGFADRQLYVRDPALEILELLYRKDTIKILPYLKDVASEHMKTLNERFEIIQKELDEIKKKEEEERRLREEEENNNENNENNINENNINNNEDNMDIKNIYSNNTDNNNNNNDIDIDIDTNNIV